MMQVLLPKTRFGLDNVRLQWKTPYEDEFALAGGHGISPYISFAFPAQRDYYDRYLTLHDLTDRERAEWIEHWRTFLQKLTWKYDRPLVLKSPCHTCRIKTILDVFPDAKFVNIHRNPFDVFRSTRHMIGIIDRYWAMQRAPLESWETRALHQYRQMYEVYFAERSLIPAGRLCETSYESLDADPVNQVRRIYESLELPDFAEFAPQLTEYVDGLAGYQKNKLPALSADDRAMVAREWAICFEQWEYATDTEERKADESE
jgi:hypothetical protein